MPKKRKIKKLPKGTKLAKHDDRECEECFYADEVDLVGDFGFARHKENLGLLIEVSAGLFMRPSIFAKDKTPLRKVRGTCYDQEGKTYIFQGGVWIPVGASYPKFPVGPRTVSAKVTIDGSQ